MKKQTGKMVRIAARGVSDWLIQIPEQALPAEQYAATELQDALFKICGARLPVVSEGTPIQGSAFYIGRTARAGTLLGRDQLESLGKEGFCILIQPDAVVLTGAAPRGTLYAVYRLLTDKLGCRWFFPGVERLKPRDPLELEMTQERHIPALEYRSPSFASQADSVWHARNFSNSYLTEQQGGQVRYWMFVHSFNTLVPVQEYFAEHPEYFSEVGGRRLAERTQLCLTNPDVLRIVIDKVQERLRADPAIDIVSISQNDSINNCTCPSCRAIDEREGSPSGSLIWFVNQVAAAVESEFPNVAIDTLAYQYTRKPPRTIRPRPNVIVRLCSIECCFSHPLEDCRENGSFRQETWNQSHFVDDLKGWAKISQRLYVWDYVTNFANYLQPFPNFQVLQKNIQFFLRHHVKGIFEQGNNSSRSQPCELNPLRQYLIARLLWDANLDVDTEVNDFLGAYFGPAGGVMRRYYDLLAQTADRPDYHLGIYAPPDSPYLTEEFLLQSGQLFAEAELQAAGEPFVSRVRVAALSYRYVVLAQQPVNTPGRAEAVEQLLADIKAAGIAEIQEGIPLAKSADRLRRGVIEVINA